MPPVRLPVELPHASRLLNHGPTVLVSSEHAQRRNVMAAAWSMPVDFTPPKIAVVIDKSTYTRELVQASGVVALNVPCAAQADMAYTVGSVGGRDLLACGEDKFRRYGIASFTGPALGLPLLEGCVAWLECRVIDEPHAQDAYDTFFVEVVSALADPSVFVRGRWSFRDDNRPLHTIHHLGGGVFAVAGDVVAAHLLGEPA
jgi:flavin reductase (DIM6/NTAB) family NADH-FMN oxidoreductase RutF